MVPYFIPRRRVVKILGLWKPRCLREWQEFDFEMIVECFTRMYTRNLKIKKEEPKDKT